MFVTRKIYVATVSALNRRLKVFLVPTQNDVRCSRLLSNRFNIIQVSQCDLNLGVGFPDQIRF